MVGGYLPPSLFQHLTLYALFKNTTKAQIIQNLIHHALLSESRRGNAIPQLINKIAEGYWISFDGKDFSAFSDSVRKDLKRRGATELQQDSILRRIGDLNKKRWAENEAKKPE